MPDKKTLVDEKTYRFFRGTDWPNFADFVEDNYQVDTQIENELDQFIAMLKEKYDNIATPKTVELSLANQKRQGQIFFDKHYKESVCRIPWQTLGVNNNGNAYICASPSWIPIFVGNLFESNNIYDILKLDIFQKWLPETWNEPDKAVLRPRKCPTCCGVEFNGLDYGELGNKKDSYFSKQDWERDE